MNTETTYNKPIRCMFADQDGWGHKWKQIFHACFEPYNYNIYYNSFTVHSFGKSELASWNDTP